MQTETTDRAANSLTQSIVTAASRTTRLQIANFVVFQLSWFCAVVGAAHHLALWGSACVLVALQWHLSLAVRPRVEAKLVGLTALLGFVIELVLTNLGLVEYPSGQPFRQLPPYWIVALWALLAIALNVNLRWLKRRLVLACFVGAVAGPASFAAGVKLGGARFVDANAALAALACVWAAALPFLMWLSNRYDGMVASK